MYVFQHPTYLSCVYASRLSKPQECRLSEFPRYVGCQNFPHIIAHRIMFLFQHPIYPSCVCASRLSSPRVCRMSEFLHIRWREISEFADFSFFRGIQEIYNGAQEHYILAHRILNYTSLLQNIVSLMVRRNIIYYILAHMGWLRLVGSIKSWVFLAKERY